MEWKVAEGGALTQKNIILNVLKEARVWVKSYELQKVNTHYGWLGTQADRAARQLAIEGLIERRRAGKYSEYRYKTPRAFGEARESVQERRRKKFSKVQESLKNVGQEMLL
jgi:hypothetical protein